MSRKKILKELENLIYGAMERAQAVQYRGNPDVNPHKIRNQYLSSVASLINSYARLSRDIELNELEEEIKELKEVLRE